MSRTSRYSSRTRFPTSPMSYALAPFHVLDDMRREMDDLVGNYLAGFDTSRSRDSSGAGAQSESFMPVIDIDRAEDCYVIAVEAPGVDPDDMSIEIDDGVLTIAGEKHAEREAEDGARRERQYGAFSRSIRLAEDIDQESISASYEHGVLTIELPRHVDDQEQKRRIEIDAKDLGARDKSIDHGGGKHRRDGEHEHEHEQAARDAALSRDDLQAERASEDDAKSDGASKSKKKKSKSD
ncbi:MAG: Hsp20/alpha crystallin family protein [Pseudomonadota bacterium]